MTRTRRAIIVVAVALLVATVILGPYLAASRSQHNSVQLADLQQTEQAVQRTEQDIAQVLTLVQSATGQPAQRAQAAAIARLIQCLNNRIDADTGHAALDPTCAALTRIP